MGLFQIFQVDLDFFIGVSGYGVFNGVTYIYIYIFGGSSQLVSG